MGQFDIFVSYRRKTSADKAEHLLSLLSVSGYEGRVSFDKDNFSGRFDAQILNRVDDCEDFIIILNKDTFSYLSEDDVDSEIISKIANCSIDEFEALESQLSHVDFVRIELARAILKKKNIIPIVPADSTDYCFCEQRLPRDISELTKYQAVYYSDNANNFLFQDILPKVVKKLVAKPRKVINTTVIKIFIGLVVALSVFAFFFLRKDKIGSYKGHDYVDLGLSVKWASCNVGADTPWDNGNYYAWAETDTKDDYSFKTYKYKTSGDSYTNVKYSKYNTDYYKGVVDNKLRLEESDDAAALNWGGKWRMPTTEEFIELIDNCKWEWTKQGDIWGYKITGKKKGYRNNSIFLPATGWLGSDSNHMCEGSKAFYWSNCLLLDDSNESDCLFFESDEIGIDCDFRSRGFTVRPVCVLNILDKTQKAKNDITAYDNIGIEKYHEYVDLGLSVKWATCNVGAADEWDYGHYYAWGDYYKKNTYAKDNYDMSYYEDVASFDWGPDWRMPTKDECVELIEFCDWKWTEENGVIGYRITSKISGYTDNSIFLPSGGYYDDSSLKSKHDGFYWTSTIRDKEELEAWHLGLFNDHHGFFSYEDLYCWNGLLVRPVHN